jgi:MFS superfamily sulfate permease-like transporter
MSTKDLSPFKNLKSDLPASIVVFLVALPLCLGIAQVSEAPALSGIIAGILGGIVVGSLSQSPLGVSGPAAGLAVIVASSIADLGGFENFLVAIIMAGILQVIMGFAKAGIIAYYFPTSVIHGMLAGIGLKIFIKQIPHAFGYDKDPEGDEEFFILDGENDFTELYNMVDYISPNIVIITTVCLAILLLWQTKFITKQSFSRIIPGPFLAVLAGIGLNLYFGRNPETAIQSDHLVKLPIFSDFGDIKSELRLPNFSVLSNPKIYLTALIITAVASIETLLCVEASDKQDTLKRITPTNRELKAQGIGNIISGFIGGLPITQVIVRSSANQQSGGMTKASTIIHGILILVSVLAIPSVLNLIPLGTLAAILLVVGYKLAKPALFKKIYHEGMGQFIPFIVTIVVMMFSDLLIGVGCGLVVAISIILRNNFKVAHQVIKDDSKDQLNTIIQLSEDVTFLNKASILRTLEKVPSNSKVTIDASHTYFIHHDVIEILEDFKINAANRNIELLFIDLNKNKKQEPLEQSKIINNK